MTKSNLLIFTILISLCGFGCSNNESGSIFDYEVSEAVSTGAVFIIEYTNYDGTITSAQNATLPWTMGIAESDAMKSLFLKVSTADTAAHDMTLTIRENDGILVQIQGRIANDYLQVNYPFD
jgi:hypothetical protein